MHTAAFGVEFLENTVDNALLMQHPAEDYIFIGGAFYKIIEQMTDVVHYYGLSLISDCKRVGAPAPVAVEENAVF